MRMKEVKGPRGDLEEEQREDVKKGCGERSCEVREAWQEGCRSHRWQQTPEPREQSWALSMLEKARRFQYKATL